MTKWTRKTLNQNIAHMRAQPEHIMMGKHDNSAIRKALLASKLFGEQLSVVSRLYDSLLQRSSRLYGCPELSATVSE